MDRVVFMTDKIYKKCLIVVDMVNGFVREGVLHDEEIAKVIPLQEKMIQEYLDKEDLVVFIKDTHMVDSVEFVRFGDTPHCLKDTNEAKLVLELQKYEGLPNTISIEKNSTSFMEAPNFRKLMKEQKELFSFDIVGCCTDICVVNGSIGLANYLDQENRKHDIRVVENAIATYSEKDRKEYVDAAKLLMKQQGIRLVKEEL